MAELDSFFKSGADFKEPPEQRIREIVSQARASMALEGLYWDDTSKHLFAELTAGQITGDAARARITPSSTQTWTQLEATAYEAAKECLGQWIAVQSSLLLSSQLKDSQEESEALALEIVRLGALRVTLRLHDTASITAVRTVYGHKLRQWHARS